MMRSIFGLMLVVGLLFSRAIPCRAESVTCAAPVRYVTLEAGVLSPWAPTAVYPRVIEGSVLEADNQDPTVIEWVVNLDAFTMNPVAHCFRDEEGKEVEDLVIPENMKRCRLDHGAFACESGTMACLSLWLDRVVIEKWKRGERIKQKRPFVLRAKEGRVVFRTLPQSKDPEVKLLAKCFQKPQLWGNRVIDVEAIPREMKGCVLADGRFICTDDPTRHDAFWPTGLGQ